MKYRIATKSDLEDRWNKNIAENPNDPRWLDWKTEFIGYNESGAAVTFCVVSDTDGAVGEGSILLSPVCKAVSGREKLCNGKDIANINCLRIHKKYEGQGHITKLFQEMERYAKSHGIKQLTIGAEAKETRNIGIYLHLGYTEFLFSETEDGELILYFGKNL